MARFHEHARRFLVVLGVALGISSPALAHQPEIELLINDSPSTEEIIPWSLLPKESVRIVVNRINGQLLNADDISVTWHSSTGLPETAIHNPDLTWKAPAKNGVYALDVVIRWKNLTLTRRVTLLVLIPIERRQEGQYLVSDKKFAKKKVKQLDKEWAEMEQALSAGPMLVGPSGLQSLRFYSQTLPSRLMSLRPGSRIYEHRDFYLKTPKGLIEVTADNQDVFLTPHLQLKDFKCKGEKKSTQYVCLDPALLLKLESLQEELDYLGVPCDRLTIMSGYRTPSYNKNIGNVKYSRHTYGDAADIYVDQNKDGRMDDVNKDGKINKKDAEYIRTVIERLEDRGDVPLGGIGTYGPKKKTGRGPFVHVDTRGFKAHW